MKAVTRFLCAPQRGVQVAIWAVLTAVLLTVVPLSAQGTASARASTSAAAAYSSVDLGPQSLASGGDTLTLAGPENSDSPAVADPLSAAGSSLVREKYADNTSGLLPAYRWKSSMELPWGSKGFLDFVTPAFTQMFDLMFFVAGTGWWILLAVMKAALSVDLVTSFSHSINGYFGAAYTGLAGAGMPLLVGAFVLCMAALRASRGKVGESVRMVVSAVLILGLLQSLGTAATADVTANSTGAGTPATTSEIPRGTPAWLALEGNKYVNIIAGQTSSVFGATSGLTGPVTSGTAGPSDAAEGGTTCAYYNQRLMATFKAMTASEGSAEATAANSMAMASFMWQKSMYDNWVLAAFGDYTDGSRLACHSLENNLGVSAEVQQAIATVGDPNSPYKGIGTGPFSRVLDHDNHNQAAQLAWAACKDGSSLRSGWNAMPQKKHTDASCTSWFNYSGSTATTGGFTNDQNGGTGDTDSLNWEDLGALNNDTLGDDAKERCAALEAAKGGTKPGCTAERLIEVNLTVQSFWANNGGQRFLSGAMALVSTGLYSYAFGGAAIGTVLTQFILLFMLIILPWTLLLLAVPDKKGGRNALGMKLLRLTGVAFAGKLTFLILMGITLTVMSALFSLTTNAGGLSTYEGASAGAFLDTSSGMYTMWGLIVPLVTILGVKFLLKAAGLGNIMSLGGAMGFATSAMSQGKDGKWASGKMSGGGGGKLSGVLSKGKKNASEAISSRVGAKALAGRGKNAYLSSSATKLLNQTSKPIDKDLADKVGLGTMSAWSAKRQQRFRAKGEGEDKTAKLSDAMAKRVESGELTRRQALNLQNASVTHDVKQAQREDLARDARAEAQGRDPYAAIGVAGDEAPLKEPVFGPPVATEPGAALQGDLVSRRAPGALAAAAAMTSVSWESAANGTLGPEIDQLCSATRSDGSSGPLTRGQHVAAREAFTAATHPVLAGNVLMSQAGSPPLVIPKYRTDGTIDVPPDADLPLALAILSNPLNMLPRDQVIRRPEEKGDDLAYHSRLTATCIEAGLVNPSTGASVDVLRMLDIDVRRPGGAEAVRVAVSDKDGALQHLQGTASLNAAQQARVDGTVRVMVATTEKTADISGGTMAQATRRVTTVVANAEKVSSSIEATLRTIDVSITDKKEAGKAQTVLLRTLEHDAVESFRAVEIEAVRTFRVGALADGGEPAAVEEQIKSMTDDAKEKVALFRQRLTTDITRLKMSPETGKEEILVLGQFAQDELVKQAKRLTEGRDDAAKAVKTANAEKVRKRATQRDEARKNHTAPPLPD